MRRVLPGFVFLAILVFVSSEAVAQFPPRIRTGIGRRSTRPTVSEYLNLLRRDGGGIGFQYYRRVLPEQEFRRANQQQFRALDQLDRRVEELGTPPSRGLGGGLGTTGHPTTFLNLGGYFGGTGGGSGFRR